MIIRLYIFLFLLLSGCCVDTDLWDYVSNGAIYIAINSDSFWSIRQNFGNAAGYDLNIWDNTAQGWTYHGGICATISIGTNYWYVSNAILSMFRKSITASPSTAWSGLGISGSDIKVSAINNHIWYLSTTTVTDGYAVYKYDESSGSSTLMPGVGAIKVAPTPDGNAWIITQSGIIKKYDGSSWTTMPGSATEIIVGSDSLPVIITKMSTTDGNTVQKWKSTSSTWTDLSGIGAIAIAVDKYNTPYIVTNGKEIYRLKGHISDICPSKHIFISACLTNTSSMLSGLF